MSGLIAAELRKLWTLRTTWVLTALGLAVLALATGELILNDPGVDAGARLDIASTSIAQIGNNSIIVLVVALLVMTTEFRHETVGRTLLLTPSRSRVLITKLAGGALYAAAFFVASLLLVTASLLAASASGRTIELNAGIGTAVWHGLAGLVLTGVLGVAVGALIRSQVVAITAALAWLFLVENLAAALNYGIGRWLPFQALNAVFLGDAAEAIEPGFIGPLAPGVALAVFVGYVVVATAGAGLLMTRRDV